MSACGHKWDSETCLFCKLEHERDEAEADAARLREALRDVLPFVLHIPFNFAPGNAALAKARAALEGTP